MGWKQSLRDVAVGRSLRECVQEFAGPRSPFVEREAHRHECRCGTSGDVRHGDVLLLEFDDAIPVSSVLSRERCTMPGV